MSLLKCFQIAENSEFPKVDHFEKLAVDLKSDSRVRVISGAKSKEGRELIAFAIGHGQKVVGVTAGAHSDEPIGVLTLAKFIDAILNQDELSDLLRQYTFLCHPLVDPDGYQLNSVWFSNPFEYKKYFLHNYRNNHPLHDCEHGIAFQPGQSMRTEMQFVKDNLDTYKGRLDYYVTLHSSHVLPGVCFVFDRDNNDESLRKRITDLCQNYELPLMDYKFKTDDSIRYICPGFLGAPNVKQMLQQYKNQPEVLKQIKMTTYEYAQSVCGAKSAFISELPIWLSQGFDQYQDSDVSLNDFKAQEFENSKYYFDLLNLLHEQLLDFQPAPDNIWFQSIQTAIKRGEGYLKEAQSKLGTYQGFAQVIDLKEIAIQRIEYDVKAYKLAIKTIELNVDASHLKNDFLYKFNRAIFEYEKYMKLKQIPIKTQVEVQLGLILSGLT